MDDDSLTGGTLTRREVLLAAAGAAAAGALSGTAGWLAEATAASAGQLDPYLSFMDTICARLDGEFSKVRGAYRPTVGGYSTVVNARMLQVHANAAAVGHTGPSRNDERAASLVSVLLEGPAPWRTQGDPHTEANKMFHVPGWTESLSDPEAAMDKAVDPQVAEALTAAWRAAETIGIDQATKDRIAQQVSACAHGPFFRYPNVRLNQLNWNCALYALDAELTGSPELLLEDYREQMMRFCRYATRASQREGTPNLGPGWHFSYLPNWPPSASFNLDAAEYANETIDAVRHYEQALAVGMKPLPPSALAILRAWAWRVLYGYWTHAGYLNWDTGLGFRRRYIGKVFALAQQGLMALASTPVVQLDPAMAGHARWLFDRGLALYMRWADEDPSGLAPPVQFGDREHAQGRESQILFAARMASNAAQAIHLGLARLTADEPPSMYSFDPDTQRLAISTPTYSTAIVVHNHGSVDYGGLDPCRLFDSMQRPVGSTGGAGIANFMARITDGHGRSLLCTQEGSRGAMNIEAHTSHGQVRRVTPSSPPYPALAYAGPMSSVIAYGSVARGMVAIHTAHRFSRSEIELSWRIGLPAHGGWEVSLPSYTRQAELIVIGRGGERSLEPGARVAMHGLRSIVINSGEGRYTVEIVDCPQSATVRSAHVQAHSGAALPGPSVLIEGRGNKHAHVVQVRLLLRVHRV